MPSGDWKRTHGLSSGPEFAAYIEAKYRCSTKAKNPNPDYAGKGIKFRFTSFEQWYSELGPRPSPKHGVDRINTLGHYEPGNIRWATQQEQCRNRRKVIRRETSSKYKGVYRELSRRKKLPTGRFRAVIVFDGSQRRLGTFSDEERAAKEYDKAARKYFGEFAHCNFANEQAAA